MGGLIEHTGYLGDADGGCRRVKLPSIIPITLGSTSQTEPVFVNEASTGGKESRILGPALISRGTLHHHQDSHPKRDWGWTTSSLKPFTVILGLGGRKQDWRYSP